MGGKESRHRNGKAGPKRPTVSGNLALSLKMNGANQPQTIHSEVPRAQTISMEKNHEKKDDTFPIWGQICEAPSQIRKKRGADRD